MSLKSMPAPNTLETNYIISKRIQKHLDDFVSFFMMRDCDNETLEFKYVSYDKKDDAAPEIIVDGDTVKQLKSIKKLGIENAKLVREFSEVLINRVQNDMMDMDTLENYVSCLHKISENLKLVLNLVNEVCYNYPRKNDFDYNRYVKVMRNEIVFLYSNVMTEFEFIEKNKENIVDSIFDYSVFHTRHGFIDGKMNKDKLKKKIENTDQKV